jgi:hypothetical protein
LGVHLHPTSTWSPWIRAADSGYTTSNLTGMIAVDQSIWLLQPAVPLPESQYSLVQVCGLILMRSGLADAGNDDTSEAYCYEIAAQNENIS